MTTSRHDDERFDGLIRAGISAFRAGDVELAEHFGREALAHEPRRGESYNLLAAVLDVHGETPAAMDMLRAALSVDPTYALARENLERLGVYPRVASMLLDDEDASVATTPKDARKR